MLKFQSHCSPSTPGAGCRGTRADESAYKRALYDNQRVDLMMEGSIEVSRSRTAHRPAPDGGHHPGAPTIAASPGRTSGRGLKRLACRL